MRWRLREACRLAVDHPRAAHLFSTPSGALPHLQLLCSRAEIPSSIQPVGARTHDTAALASVSGCDSTSACRLRTGPPPWRSTIRRRPCEKANIGEQLPLVTQLRSFVLDRACSYVVPEEPVSCLRYRLRAGYYWLVTAVDMKTPAPGLRLNGRTVKKLSLMTVS